MASYLYGLIRTADAARIPAGVMGIDGTPMRALECGTLTALVGSVERVPSRERLDDVRAHDAALRGAMQGGATVAASRFGQIFASDDELRREVAAGARALAQHLEQCAGCVEMRLLLPEPLPPEEPVPFAQSAGSPGRAYLEGVRARMQADARVGVKPALGPVVRAERVEGTDTTTTFAHLVLRTDVEEYRAAVSAFPALADARVVGPLPLYSFAEP